MRSKVALVDVLHHGDLELTGKTNNRGGAQEGQRHPSAIKDIACTVDYFRIHPLEYGSNTTGHSEHNEQTDGQQGNQFDHGLHRYSRHHAVMSLVGVQVACAE